MDRKVIGMDCLIKKYANLNQQTQPPQQQQQQIPLYGNNYQSGPPPFYQQQLYQQQQPQQNSVNIPFQQQQQYPQQPMTQSSQHNQSLNASQVQQQYNYPAPTQSQLQQQQNTGQSQFLNQQQQVPAVQQQPNCLGPAPILQNPLEPLNITCKICNQQNQIEDSPQIFQQSPFFYCQKCQKCQNQLYFFQCKCGSIISQSCPFAQGQRIVCPASKDVDSQSSSNSTAITCLTKEQQFLICPNQSCKSLNFFTGQYCPGSPTVCWKCKIQFQQISCPRCFMSIFYDCRQINCQYIPGLSVTCYACGQQFQHLNCPYCFHVNYANDGKYKLGQEMKCKDCEKTYQYIICPNVSCRKSHYFYHKGQVDLDKPQGEKAFLYGRYEKCQSCNNYFEFSQCPFCENLNYSIHSFKLADFGLRRCSIQTCDKQYKLVQCPGCFDVNSVQNFTQNTNSNINKSCKSQNAEDVALQQVCQTCKIEFTLISCKRCQSTYGELITIGDLSKLQKKLLDLKCKMCDFQLLNLPQSVRLSQEVQKNLKQETGSGQNNNIEDEDKYICKICYCEKANYINIQCGHLVCCGTCVTSLKKTCPLCRQPGEFKKIYI